MDVIEDLANRLRKRQKQLRRWATRTGCSAWRIYDRDLPDHPATVDWYDGHAVVWTRARTRDETPEADDAWVGAVLQSIEAALAVPAGRIFLKRRERQRGLAQYDRFGQEGFSLAVQEGPLRFAVNLSDYLDTGLFLDHRPTRAQVLAEARGRRCLNLFCYTGSFTCAMAVGGATSTCSVDLSHTYLDWAGRNLGLNGHQAGERHRLIRGDCLTWLREAAAAGERFDLVVCDPPTFSNSKATVHDLVIGRDWQALLLALRGICAAGATVYFSTNFRAFEGDPATVAGFSGSEISAASVPEDFRDRRIHRCWRLEAGR
jgi:23S rRNA (cytosine1962-C5)-methyltransferase